MEQERNIFDKETLLDLTVNIIPLFIMVFFLLFHLPMVYGPFNWEPTFTLLQIGLMVVPIVSLTLLTYLSALAIEGDEKESETRSSAETPMMNEPGDASDQTDDESADSADDEATTTET